jgi:hypothetical protein
MLRLEQELSDGIIWLAQILTPSHLIGFDQQPFLVVQSNGLFIQERSWLLTFALISQ